MAAQNAPTKIPLDGQLLDPVEWLRRTGVTLPPTMQARHTIEFMTHRYLRTDQLCEHCRQKENQ